MSNGRPVAWILGLGALAATTTAGAIALMWISSDLLIQVNEIWSSQPTDEPVSPEVYEQADLLSVRAYAMQTVVTPLLTGAIAAVFALLAVLAFRWERSRQFAATLADEPATAS